MLIRKLELHGFKSFPDRTSFHFGNGVSGVVGPNGCGKSNIVDAVLWGLGEQSPRVLRGRSMDDVIFAGSTERNPMGLAEVTITFEAGDEPFPGEYARCAEVQVTRRLHRDGTSEYLINQQRVRLRDVHDLFLDTGIGNRMYSVIEQGRIGEIVNARPEQRRALIEEAAGISRYKVRRKEAESRLGETLHNLERVTDLVTDLGKRLRSLDRQVEKATRYRRLRAKVRQGEVYLGLARFAGLAADRKALREQVRAAEAEERALTRRLEDREKALGEARGHLEAREAEVGRVRDRLAEVEATRREQESARQYQARESTELERRVEALTGHRAQSAEELAHASRRVEESTAERAGIEQRLTDGDAQLSGARDDSVGADRQVAARRDRIERGKSSVMARITEVTRARAGREGLEARRTEQGERLAAVRERQEAAGTDLRSLAEAEQSAGQDVAAAEARLAAAREAFTGAEQRVVGLASARASRATALRAAQDAHTREARAEAGLRARLESLQALQERHDGVDDGVRAALQAPGALGTLAEHLDVPADLEAAVATALGEALNHVLTADADAAVVVARAAEGRAGVVSLEGAVPPVTGFAARIGGTEQGRRALGRLLGDCGEAPDLAAAVAWARENGRACSSACGAFVDASGTVLVGAPSGGGAAILARRRQIATLTDEVAALAARVLEQESTAAAASRALELAEAEVDAGRARVEESRALVNEAELAVRDARHQLRERASRHSHHRDLARTLAREESEAVERLAGFEREIAELSARIDVAEAAQVQAEEALRTDQAALGAEESAANRAREALARLAAEVSGLRERLVGVRRSEAAARAGAEAAARQIESCDEEMTSASQRLVALAEDDARLATSLEALGEEQTVLRASLDEGRELLRVERAALVEAEKKLRHLRDQREAATHGRLELERQVEKIRAEITHIRDSLEERYQISVAGLLDRMDRDGHVVVEVDDAARAVSLPGEDAERWARLEPVDDLRITAAMLEDPDTIQSWVEQLGQSRDRLSRLGEVNLVALDEYTEVSGEHDTLEAQRADLEESVKSIRQTIARLNRICRERFRETFDQVDGMFRNLYPRLVGGGKAHLTLTNEEDLLETGVDIYVQPPGKRLVHLSLLSGGETAMTAIALIFSLFRVKPSPFCLLDEVDAPLDEGNGARFNGMLREMAETSQFIVITHNKKTMECMDTLYGVTMPAPGVSRLVSVQLE